MEATNVDDTCLLVPDVIAGEDGDLCLPFVDVNAQVVICGHSLFRSLGYVKRNCIAPGCDPISPVPSYPRSVSHPYSRDMRGIDLWDSMTYFTLQAIQRDSHGVSHDLDAGSGSRDQRGNGSPPRPQLKVR